MNSDENSIEEQPSTSSGGSRNGTYVKTHKMFGWQSGYYEEVMLNGYTSIEKSNNYVDLRNHKTIKMSRINPDKFNEAKFICLMNSMEYNNNEFEFNYFDRFKPFSGIKLLINFVAKVAKRVLSMN